MMPRSPTPHRPPVSPVEDIHRPEPDDVAAPADDAAELPLPGSPQTFFLAGLFVLAVVAALYAASAIILPIVLAFILMLLLQPAVRLLERVRLPRALGALLVILLVIGSLVGLVAALSVPAATWAERLPQGIPRLEAHLVVLKRPLEALQALIQQQPSRRLIVPDRKGPPFLSAGI